MSAERIKLVPDLFKEYPHIPIAHKAGKLIIFIGAGVSTLWGCRRWPEMAQYLMDKCYESEKIDHWTKKILVDKYQYNPRKLITIAKSIMGDKYLDGIRGALQTNEEKRIKYPSIFANLAALNAIFITTNIDVNLSSLLDSRNVHMDSKKFHPSLLKPKTCFHLHGRIDVPESLVMTIDEYLRRYREEEIKAFLDHVFFKDNYAVLFVGYSIDEMEIIDFMLEKHGPQQKGQINKSYVLMPMFSKEEDILMHEENYFDLLGTTVIPYAIDRNGYEQLYQLLSDWTAAMLERDVEKEFYNLIKLIEANK